MTALSALLSLFALLGPTVYKMNSKCNNINALWKSITHYCVCELFFYN